VRRKISIEAAADIHVSAIFSETLAHRQEAAFQTRPVQAHLVVAKFKAFIVTLNAILVRILSYDC
jgi:hypothetical protein